MAAAELSAVGAAAESAAEPVSAKRRRVPEPTAKKTPSGVSPFVAGAFDCLLEVPTLRLDGPRCGYRNKITYSVHQAGGVFNTTDLAREECNAVCRSVHQWASTREGVWCKGIHEVCAKVSRSGAVMVKLFLVMSAEQQAKWVAEEFPRFVEVMLEQHPTIATIVSQRSDSPSKPGKDEGTYTTLYGPGFLRERTPNGVPYVISADSFCEINHFMEDRIWTLLDRWLPRRVEGVEGEPAWDLLIMGRDSNPLAVGLFPLMHGRHSCRRGYSVCHCPRVMRDLHSNVKEFCRDADKMGVHGVDGKFKYADTIRALGDGVPIRVVINAGRSGMAPQTVKALSDHPLIEQIITFSCNPKTLAPNATALAKSGFGVANYRSLDFFPGTDYVMQAVDFRRPWRALVLPVGPPGSGKSTLGRGVESWGLSGSAVERDRIYAKCRSSLPSFAQAKRAAHAEVCSAMRSGAAGGSCLVYDSTNGDASGRDWATGEAAAGWDTLPRVARRVVVVAPLRPAVPDADAQLVGRCLQRPDHPAFPGDAKGAEAKVALVHQNIQWPTQSDTQGVPGGVDRAVLPYLDPLVLSAEDVALLVFLPVFLADGLWQHALHSIHHRLRNFEPPPAPPVPRLHDAEVQAALEDMLLESTHRTANAGAAGVTPVGPVDDAPLPSALSPPPH
eukprot:Hpha_TRINITY_DN18925_c0_g1::TRINITY_DN18925_c0_g1_i1::g.17661::m.17661